MNAMTSPATRRAAVSAGAVLAITAGCGTAGLPTGSTTTVPSVEFGWFAYGDPSATDASGLPNGTPVDAVERAGLTLPANAKVQRVETQSLDGRAESYLFVFDVDPATAVAFCRQDGLGGARQVTALPSNAAASLGDVALTDGSRWCQSASPKDARWSRYVLIDDGDPARVHLSLQRVAS